MDQRTLHQCGFGLYLVGNDDLSEEEFGKVIEAIQEDDIDRLRELGKEFDLLRNW